MGQFATGTAPDHVLPESGKTPFYPALDGIRTVAVGLVMLVHFLPQLFPYGWMGVQTFFVLSGFLITGILFDTRNDPHRYRNFYARRTLRIFPLYYTFLGALLIILLVTHGHAPGHFWMWFAYVENFRWLFFPGRFDDFVYAGRHGFAAIGHLWSLAVEEQFYLLWPPVVFLVRNRTRLMQICVAGILARLVFTFGCQHFLSANLLSDGLLYRMLPTQCDGFLLGGLLALWLRGNPSRELLRHTGKLSLAILIAFCALLRILPRHPGIFAGQDVRSYVSTFQICIGIPLCNLVSAIVLLAVIERGTWANRLAGLAPLRSLGRVSYGIYVFHLMVYITCGERLIKLFSFVHPHLASLALSFLGCAAITAAISYVSYFFYERHFLLLKNRFTTTR